MPPSRALIDFADVPASDVHADILIIGGGVAGLSAAIAAAEQGARVVAVMKENRRSSNTEEAQGGVAAVLGDEDSFEDHRDDTVAAGAGLCDPAAVECVVQEGPDRIKDLIDWGGRFDHVEGDLHLTLEGGHSRRRVIHAHGDQTGTEVQGTLVRRAAQMENIELHEHGFAVDLVMESGACAGAVIWRRGELTTVRARATLLCTGGAGQLYRETSNPGIATGDGIGMAWRAGAGLRDMEFIQFHPTTLYVAGSARHLITEAVRGEGGYLRDMRGERFMVHYHLNAELAPRDVVSRSIAFHLASTGDSHVFLDMSHQPGEFTRERFPRITEVCRLYNLDVTRYLIPVLPSVHYIMGGITVDLDWRTDVPRLYACGEVASSGLHGANRLASNSLVEGLVFGRRAGLHAASMDDLPSGDVEWPRDEFTLEGSVINVPDMLNSIKSLMWKDVGIVRTGEGLRDAVQRLRDWSHYVFQCRFADPAGWELVNVLTCAHAVAASAEHRCESRGAHFRSDFPERDDGRWGDHTPYPLPEEPDGREA